MKKMIFSLTLLSVVAQTEVHAFRPAPESENVGELIVGRQILSLDEAARLGLNEGRTNLDVWSGNYWPHYQGSLAVRYRDASFISLINKNEQYGTFKELTEKKPLYTYSGRENLLSPAEKYDLVVGDRTMGLTKYSWDLGRRASLIGDVPIWRGICDGWASAGQMMPRPRRSVVMNTPEGTPVTFYPEDIKALGSLLYARAQGEPIFIGKRCRSRLLGLFTNACDETNAANLHLALLNRVGKMGKSFIADVSPGPEVWNYPVKEYSINYYNVLTDDQSNNFLEVAEPFVRKNRFARSGKRHKRTAFVVGVKAVVRYADMRRSNLLEVDSEEQDKVLEKEYLYDLELDHSYNVLGGEAFSGNLPDFIWAPNDRTYPLSEVEVPGVTLMSHEIPAMALAASRLGQPLSVIVERLFEASK
jgi:hypothetical protein